MWELSSKMASPPSTRSHKMAWLHLWLSPPPFDLGQIKIVLLQRQTEAFLMKDSLSWDFLLIWFPSVYVQEWLRAIFTLEPKPFIWAGFIFADFVHKPINIQKKHWAHTRPYDAFGMRATMSNERKNEKKFSERKRSIKTQGFFLSGYVHVPVRLQIVYLAFHIWNKSVNFLSCTETTNHLFPDKTSAVWDEPCEVSAGPETRY